MTGLKFILRRLVWLGVVLMVFSVVQVVASDHVVAWRFALAVLLIIVGSLGIERRYGASSGSADMSPGTYTYDPNNP
jgi:hypothetical protein